MRVNRKAVPVLALAAVLVTACSNTPPPPVVSSSVPPASTTGKTPSQIVVGVDDVLGG